MPVLALCVPQAVDRMASLRVWRDEKSFESFVTSQQSPQPSEYSSGRLLPAARRQLCSMLWAKGFKFLA